jgi:hypothetical protein
MRPAQVRRAIESHREWMESRLGIPLSEAVIIAHHESLTEAAICKILDYKDDRVPTTKLVRRLKVLVESVEIPPSFPAYIELGEAYRLGDLSRLIPAGGAKETSPYAIAWVDCPVLFHIRDFEVPIVALSVYYCSTPDSVTYSVEHVVIAARNSAEQVISLLRSLTKPDNEPESPHTSRRGTEGRPMRLG